MARTFNGTTANIRTTIATPQNIGFGTIAAILKRNGTGWGGILGLHNSGGTACLNLEIGDGSVTNGIRLQGGTGGDIEVGGLTLENADGWALIAAGKGTGNVTGEVWRYTYTNNTWTNSATTATMNNASLPGTSGTIRFGQWETTDFWAGDMALVGLWDRRLTDAEVRNLPFSLAGWYSSNAVGLWLFDQSATTQNVINLLGNGANQSAITSTTVSTNSVPVFNYGDGAYIITRPPAAGGAVTGTGALTIAAPSLSGSGTNTPPAVTGTGALTIAKPTLSASATETFTATSTITIAKPIVAASGAETFTGTSSVTIAKPTVSGSGTLTFTGTSALTIAKPSLSGSGTAQAAITGTAALTIDNPSLSGTGTKSVLHVSPDTSVYGDFNSTSPLLIPRITTADPDDILVLVYYVETDIITTATADGFTQLAELRIPASDPDHWHWVFARRVAADEPDLYPDGYDLATPESTGTTWRTAAMIAISGVPNDIAIADLFTVGADNSGTGTTITALGITPATNSGLLIFSGTNFNGNTSTPPTGFEEQEDYGNLAISTAYNGSTSATGNKSATVASTDWSAVLLHLRETAVSAFTGTATITISRPTLAASGSLSFTGTAALTIGKPSLSGSGLGAPGVTGTGAVTISKPTVSATALETFTGTSALTIAKPTISGTATETFTGTVALTIQKPSLSGAAAQGVAGVGTIVISKPALAGTGNTVFIYSGTGAITIAKPTIAASGKETFTGSAALTIPKPTISGTSLLTFSGTGALLIRKPTITATGLYGFVFGTGAITIRPPSISSTGALSFTGTGTLLIGRPQVNGSAILIVAIGSGAILIAHPTLVGAGFNLAPGVIITRIPATYLATDSSNIYVAIDTTSAAVYKAKEMIA